jgi:hypothetical protein
MERQPKLHSVQWSAMFPGGSMKGQGKALRNSLYSGTIASLASTAALSLLGKGETGSPYAPNNAISHWFWGGRALRQDGASLRYTLTGYAIHHASSTLWAFVYERWLGQRGGRTKTAAAAGGAAVAALACFSDYNLTPPRFRPGFEKRLSTPSLALVYAAFGAGLALRGLAEAARAR